VYRRGARISTRISERCGCRFDTSIIGRDNAGDRKPVINRGQVTWSFGAAGIEIRRGVQNIACGCI
jgi:hypothetical protein